MWIIGKELL